MIALLPDSIEDAASKSALPAERGSASTPAARAGADRQWRVLAGIGAAPTNAVVVRHARAVARGLDLAVTVARVVETPRHDSPIDPLEWQMRQSECRRNLEQVTAAERGDAKVLESVLLAGPAAEQLTSWARDNDVTLLAVATHERPTSGGHGLGTTAQGVLDQGETSMLLIPAGCAAGEALSYRRILVPLDGSPRAESVIPVATRIARAHGAELILAHVVPRLEIVDEAPLEAQAQDLCARLAEHNERGARIYLEELRGRLWKEKLPVRSIVATAGDPRTLLRRMIVEQHVDLVVMSSHGKSGMGDMPCGSVTEYLATHAAVPLLIVRPNFAHVFGSAREPTAETGPKPIPESAR